MKPALPGYALAFSGCDPRAYVQNLMCECTRARAVGGIYTVIKTKTEQTVIECGENYVLLGPYVDDTAKLQFEEQALPNDDHPFLAEAITAMRKRGVGVHYGRWLIDGAPKVWLCMHSPCPARQCPSIAP
jgi:glycogen(starch) synthase